MVSKNAGKKHTTSRSGMKKFARTLTARIVIYALLFIFGFVFVYPLIYMVLRSFMSGEDIFNPLVNLIPSKFTLSNYRTILEKINLWGSLAYSVILSVVSSLLQMLCCGLMGYGLSRFQFKLKKVYLALVIATFVIPSQVLMIPTYLGYSELHLIGTPLSFFIPALLGQGLKSAIFILIFFSFFNTLPKALDEAALIDGCNAFGIFARIAIPLSVPAVVLTMIFSVVWYWNENYLTLLYIGESAKTLPNQMAVVLSQFENDAIRDPLAAQVNIPVKMAASCLTLLPLIIFYLVLQRQFVESVDRAGITGE